MNAKQIRDLTNYAASIVGHGNADDVVQEVYLASREKTDIRGFGWYFGATRHLAHEWIRQERRERALVALAGPCLTYEGEDALVPMDRCKHRTRNRVAPVGSGQGFRLEDVPCPVCGQFFKPVKVRANHRKSTCGTPHCVTTQAMRTRNG